jgi:L-fucose mutarotase/ribose pyranase (RbsD/FucU family)
MKKRTLSTLSAAALLAALAAAATLASCGGGDGLNIVDTNVAVQASGRQIFRHDTFGDEIFWTDKLRMNEVIEQAVSPKVALSVGLKVDADALPQR